MRCIVDLPAFELHWTYYLIVPFILISFHLLFPLYILWYDRSSYVLLSYTLCVYAMTSHSTLSVYTYPFSRALWPSFPCRSRSVSSSSSSYTALSIPHFFLSTSDVQASNVKIPQLLGTMLEWWVKAAVLLRLPGFLAQWKECS